VRRVKARNNFDFYEIALKELMKINYRREIIPFPLVFNRLGTMFHFDKRSSVVVLKNLERRGHVEIIPFKGIRILDEKFKYKYFQKQ